MEGENRRAFQTAMAFMTLSKLLSIMSPFFLKHAVNALMVAGGAVNFKLAALGVIGFGIARISSSILHEARMVLIAKMMQTSLKKIAVDVFEHIHKLDLSFQRSSSKNIIFAVNKAIGAMENGLRFVLGFAFPTVLEFALISGMLFFYCGPQYFCNIMLMIAIYTKFTKDYSKWRQGQIRMKR